MCGDGVEKKLTRCYCSRKKKKKAKQTQGQMMGRVRLGGRVNHLTISDSSLTLYSGLLNESSQPGGTCTRIGGW